MNKLFFLCLLLFSFNCLAADWKCFKLKNSDYMNEFCVVNVPHGWIVNPYGYNIMFFYPDEKHEWKVE